MNVSSFVRVVVVVVLIERKLAVVKLKSEIRWNFGFMAWFNTIQSRCQFSSTQRKVMSIKCVSYKVRIKMSSTDSDAGDAVNNQLLSSTAINSSPSEATSSFTDASSPSRPDDAMFSALSDGSPPAKAATAGVNSFAGITHGNSSSSDVKSQRGDVSINVTNAGSSNSTSKPIDLNQKISNFGSTNDLAPPPRNGKSSDSDSERGSARSG